MRILVACEESQEVCKAFRAMGHEAYSCDIEPCSGGHPEWHLKCDALELLKIQWDMILAFPPCSQEVEPYMFGHPVKKKTRLWLKGLPPLKPTNIVDPKCGCHEAGTWFMVGGKDRQKNRAKTFPGLAKAMAEQWGRLLPPEGEKNNG